MNFDSVVFLIEKVWLISTQYSAFSSILLYTLDFILMALSKLIGHPFYYRTLKSKLSFHQVIKFKSEFGTAGKSVFTMSGV